MGDKEKIQLVSLLFLAAFALSRADEQDICKGVINGVYKHPTDDTKFLRCFHGYSFPAACPKGFVFDGEKRYCVPPNRPSKGKAKECIKSKCKLPHCLCASTEAPNHLARNETPQMVMISFNDAITVWDLDFYLKVFYGRKNPNKCNSTGTFFVRDVPTEYNLVQFLHNQGHEIADHTVTHRVPTTWWKNATFHQWVKEIKGEREYIKSKGKVPNVYGFRAPFLQLGGNAQFDALMSLKFLYDSSIPTGGHQDFPPLWPYTFDYRSPQVDHCNIKPCPTDSFPGLWEVPLVVYHDKDNNPCAMYDGCNATSEQEVYNLFMYNFLRHYETNKAPFPVFGHVSWFIRNKYNLPGLLRFLNDIQKKHDVYIVSIEKVIRWMENPTPLQDLHKLKDWQC